MKTTTEIRDKRYPDDYWEFYQLKLDGKPKWFWRRKAKNGRIVGVACKGYANKVDCHKNAAYLIANVQ